MFWLGFDIAMSGKLPQTDDEHIWHGWSYGAMEYCRFFYVTKWEGRRRRFRQAIVTMRWRMKKMIRTAVRRMKLQCGILIDEPF